MLALVLLHRYGFLKRTFNQRHHLQVRVKLDLQYKKVLLFTIQLVVAFIITRDIGMGK